MVQQFLCLTDVIALFCVSRVFEKFKQIAPNEQRHLKGKVQHRRVVNDMPELKVTMQTLAIE